MADDHELVRSGLKALVQQQFPTMPVIETGDGGEALELMQKHSESFALLDITLPTLNGLDIVKHARKSGFKGKIVMLSMHHSPIYVARAWQNGADGYVLKDAAFEELLDAIDQVMKGHRYLSKGISAIAVDDVMQYMDPAHDELLTPRQRQVLQMVAEGKSSKFIAHELNVSIKTVEAHRSSIMNRLGVHDMAGMVKAAISLGLTDIE
ncbi:response regulator [Pseudidiomarina sp.]|uniref:response regulator n=1 Tax=Pseudidiomarina sp. TaxID=2081707 RepID=UPI003A98242F